MNKKIIVVAIFFALIAVLISFQNRNQSQLPVVAIANYGPHASLDASIKGFKEQMSKEGFIENKTISYEIVDVGFDSALIPQMITSLKQHDPKVLVAMTTPVAQFAKGKIQSIPLVYNVITDPIVSGLIKERNQPYANMAGSSDMQDLRSFLQFAKAILPHAKRIGLLYATSESNDVALVKMMQAAASSSDMEVVAIPIEQARDVPIRVQKFQGKVDLIYVGTSGPIQPTLPAIAAEAQKMRIPVFNVEAQAVQDGLALASFGVNYEAVGRNAGKLVAALLNGKEICDLPPTYPSLEDHHGVINKKKAAAFGIKIPEHIEVVE